jgi:Tfp pilus assembly protein PilF
MLASDGATAGPPAGGPVIAPAARTGLATGIAACALVLAVVASYTNAIPADFVHDDVLVVRDNPEIRDLRAIPEFFRSSYGRSTSAASAAHVHNELTSWSVYRPLVMASFAGDFQLWGLNPSGYHLTNLLLHLAATLAAWRLLGALALPPAVPLTAALLFAVHPVHTEAVTGVVGRAEVLYALFALLSLRAYVAFLRRGFRSGAGYLALCGLAFAVSLLAKEMAVMVPFLALLLERLAIPNRPVPGEWAPTAGPVRGIVPVLRGAALRSLPFALILVAYLLVRRNAVGSLIGAVGIFDLYPIPYTDRLLLMIQVFGVYARLMLLPFPLLATHRWNGIPEAMRTSLTDPGVLFGIAVLAVVAVTAIWARRRAPGVTVGIAAFYLALFPVSNLVFSIGAVYSERALYLPSLAACALLASLLVAAADRRGLSRRVALACLVGVLVLPWTGMTILRNRDWASQERLFEDLVHKDPANWRNNLGLAQVRVEQGRLPEALALYDRVVEHGGADVFVLRNRGVIHAALGHPKAAEADLSQALRIPGIGAPAEANLRLWRARARRAQGNIPGAGDDLAAAERLAPDDPEIPVEYGAVLMSSRRPDLALPRLERAAAQDPARALAPFARAALAAGRPELARDVVRRLAELHLPIPEDLSHLARPMP